MLYFPSLSVGYEASSSATNVTPSSPSLLAASLTNPLTFKIWLQSTAVVAPSKSKFSGSTVTFPGFEVNPNFKVCPALIVELYPTFLIT